MLNMVGKEITCIDILWWQTGNQRYNYTFPVDRNMELVFIGTMDDFASTLWDRTPEYDEQDPVIIRLVSRDEPEIASLIMHKSATNVL